MRPPTTPGLRRAYWVFILALAACSQSPAPDAGRLLITSSLTDEVWVLDAATGSTVKRHSLDVRRAESDEPHGVVVSPDNRHWYATVAHGSPTLWKFDRLEDRLVGRLELPTNGASRIGIDPQGRYAWVPDYWRSGQGRDGQVAVVDLVDLSLVATPTVCPAPHDAQVAPQGSVVAVTCSGSDEVVLLDSGSHSVLTRTTIGPRPMNVVWRPDGAAMYITLMGGEAVAEMTTAGGVGETVAVGANPAQLALDASGTTLVVANRGDASVSVVDVGAARPSSERVRIRLARADHPHGVALNPAGSVAFVTFEGTTDSPGGVVALDLTSGTELWRTVVDGLPLGVAWMVGPG